jgi:hypothetical protein
MSTIPVDTEQCLGLLRRWLPGKASDLEQVLNGLRPALTVRIETQEPGILFQADSATNTITLGAECSRRLEAHAYAAAVLAGAHSTPTRSGLSEEQVARADEIASTLLTWAVSRDLQQRLPANGCRAGPGQVMQRGEQDLPPGILNGLTIELRAEGRGLFELAFVFIFLHEIAHLHFRHTKCEGEISWEQERQADHFAAEWMVTAAGGEVRQLQCLLGIAVALLWLAVFNAFLGPSRGERHPQAYDRLFQTLNACIGDDPVDNFIVWGLVAKSLYVHLDTAGIKLGQLPSDPKDLANHLIDIISRQCSR